MLTLPRINYKKIFLIIYIFVFVYNPPLIKGIDLERILAILSVIYIFLNYGVCIQIWKQNVIRKFFIRGLGVCMYAVLCVLINMMIRGNTFSDYSSSLIGLILSVFYSVIFGLTILIVCRKEKIESREICLIFCVTILIQAMLAILAFVFPDIRTFFTETISHNLGENSKIGRYVLDISSKRNYGFANNLYDMIGYSTSLAVALSFNLALYKEKKYYIFTILFLFIPFLNTRTGILLSFFAIVLSICIFVFYEKSAKQFGRLIVGLILGVALIFMFISYMSSNAINTYNWMISGLQSTYGLLGGTTSDYYSIAFTADFWRLPNVVESIFGTGMTSAVASGNATDVGYINMIWQYGIIGLLMSLLLYTYPARILLKKTVDIRYKPVMVCFMLVFILYLIKLSAFRHIGGTYLLVILPFAMLLCQDNEELANK